MTDLTAVTRLALACGHRENRAERGTLAGALDETHRAELQTRRQRLSPSWPGERAIYPAILHSVDYAGRQAGHPAHGAECA